jgi:hypothetical protein
MASIVISVANVAGYPDGGGHFWVYMQYVQALRRLGCEVHWLERFRRTGDEASDRAAISLFLARMKAFGMAGKVILYTTRAADDGELPCEFMTTSKAQAERIIDEADLLLNSYYAIEPALLRRFRRTALVDIDPGLLQFWATYGQISIPKHDLYFTTGETVGTERARFGDCGVEWLHIRPPICLDLWPYSYDSSSTAMTTVSGWWGGDGKGEWITDGKGVLFENNKRVTFMQFVDLPTRTAQVLELALCLGDGDPPEREQFQQQGHSWTATALCPEDITDYESDEKDRAILEHYGWRVIHATRAAGTPQRYQQYIQQSRGEFSCAKPSCMYFQNAWVSDRTLCYLASGKPVVVQDTGPSDYLPNGEGMFRFSSMDEAVDSLARMNADYERHCRAARELAESYFDGCRTLAGMLERAL